MEKLTIELDCNEETCGNCMQVVITGDGYVYTCKCFGKRLHDIKGVRMGYIRDCFRLPECIAACKAQKENV